MILVIGVNGSGKTTSIAKLAHMYTKRGRKVLLAAADTFRAAAIDQLQIWGERSGVAVIAGAPNSDPGAVVFDSVQAAFARKADLLLVDTAGRLHTKHNLMQELKKDLRHLAEECARCASRDVVGHRFVERPERHQPRPKGFTAAAGVTGAILTKLDGTPKGGVAFAISSELKIPIRFITTGEKLDDIEPFDAKAFVDELFT